MFQRYAVALAFSLFLAFTLATHSAWAAKGGNGGGGGKPNDDPPPEPPPFKYVLEILPVLEGTLGRNQVNAMNDDGDMVGISQGRAVLWTEEGLSDLNDLLPEGSDWFLSEAKDINNFGQVIGSGWLPEFETRRQYRYTPGDPAIIEDLTTAGMDEVWGINDLDEVAGTSNRLGAIYAGTPGEAGQVTLVPEHEDSDHYSTRAHAINNAGQVVGYTYIQSGQVHEYAFRYTPDAESGQEIELFALNDKSSGLLRSLAWDINEHGWTVGEAVAKGKPQSPKHAFRFKDEIGIEDLGTLGGSESRAYAINKAGDVVGTSSDGSAYRGFIYIDGFGMVNLDDLVVADDDVLALWSAGNVYPRAINNSDGIGQVSGYFTSPGDALPHLPFLLTPEPLP